MDETYLHQRGRVWWYFRRVPKQYAHLDTRGMIRQTPATTAHEEARLLRDALAEADELYWSPLVLASEAGGRSTNSQTAAAKRRHQAACKRALASGFKYVPTSQLSEPAHIEDTFQRLLEVQEKSDRDEVPRADVAEALLGGAPEPSLGAVTVTGAFEIYVSEIAFDEQKKKSPKQQYSWEKTK